MNDFLTRCSMAVAVSILAVTAVPAVAQKQSVPSAVPSNGVVCMIRSTEGEQHQPIILPSSDVAAMTEREFAIVPCQSVFLSQEAQLAWREAVCTITATMNENVQAQIALSLGEQPAVLCGMAEQALGPWQRDETTSGPDPSVLSEK